MPRAWLGAFRRKVGKCCGFGAPRVGFGRLLGACLLVRAGCQPLWIYRPIVALVLIQSWVQASCWSASLQAPVLSSSLLVLLLGLKLTDPARYPSHT